MKYLAHFSFDELDHSKHGYFTMMLSAEDTESAIRSLRNKIMSIRNNSHAFDEMDEIFLDDIIEIDHFPEKPVMMRYESMDLSDQSTLSSNPIEGEGLHVFHWWPKDKAKEYQKEKYNIEPFVKWH